MDHINNKKSIKMSRITQDIADKVSAEIVKPIEKKIKEAEEAIGKFAYDIILKTIPEEVMKVYKKHPDYIEDGCHVYMKGVGIERYIACDIPDRLPSTEGYSRTLHLTDTQATKAVKLKNKVDDLTKKKTDTEQEIYNLLLSLRTYKRVQAELPEIYPYLPNSNAGKELMIIPSVVREKIACLISSDVEKKCIDQI